MNEKKSDRHKSKLTAIRFPDDVKEDLKQVSEKYHYRMNIIVVEGTKEILKKIKATGKLI